jgi:hypothetical protein
MPVVSTVLPGGTIGHKMSLMEVTTLQLYGTPEHYSPVPECAIVAVSCASQDPDKTSVSSSFQTMVPWK